MPPGGQQWNYPTYSLSNSHSVLCIIRDLCKHFMYSVWTLSFISSLITTETACVCFRHSGHRPAGLQRQQSRGSGPGEHRAGQRKRKQEQLQDRDGWNQYFSPACYGRLSRGEAAQHRPCPGAGGRCQQPHLRPSWGPVRRRGRGRGQGGQWQRWECPLVGSALRVSR